MLKLSAARLLGTGFVAAALILGLVATPASAATITRSGFVSFATTDYNGVLSVQQWNDGWGLGTLTGVSATLTVNGNLLYTLQAPVANSVTVYGNVGLYVYAARPNGVDYVDTTASYTIAPSFPTRITVPAGTTYTTGSVSAMGSDTYIVDSTDWHYYTGSGYVNLPLFATTQTSTTIGGSGYTQGLLAGGNAKIDVVYEYTPPDVPEPLTMGLFGSGLLLIGVLGRKRFIR